MYIYTYVHTYNTHTHIHMYVVRTYVHTYIYTHTHIHVTITCIQTCVIHTHILYTASCNISSYTVIYGNGEAENSTCNYLKEHNSDISDCTPQTFSPVS